MKRLSVIILAVVVLFSGLGMAAPESADACLNGVRRHQKQRQRLVVQVRNMVSRGDYRSAVSMALQITGKRFRKPKDGEDRVAAEALAIALVRMNPSERDSMGAVKKHFRGSKQALKWANQRFTWAAKRDKSPQNEARAAEAQLASGKNTKGAIATLEGFHDKGLVPDAGTYRTMALHFGEGTKKFSLYQGECLAMAGSSKGVCGVKDGALKLTPKLKNKIQKLEEPVPRAKPRGKLKMIKRPRKFSHLKLLPLQV